MIRPVLHRWLRGIVNSWHRVFAEEETLPAEFRPPQAQHISVDRYVTIFNFFTGSR